MAEEKTTIQVEDKNLEIKKTKKKNATAKETPTVKKVEESEAKSAEEPIKKEYKVNEVMETLKARQLDLEHHIQSELIELSEVVNKQYGNSDQKFDYQLIRVTDNRPAPVW